MRGLTRGTGDKLGFPKSVQEGGQKKHGRKKRYSAELGKIGRNEDKPNKKRQ